MRYWLIDVSEADVLAKADQVMATAGEGMRLSGLVGLLRRLERYAVVPEELARFAEAVGRLSES